MLREGIDALDEEEQEARHSCSGPWPNLKVDPGRFAEAREIIEELRETVCRPGCLEYLEGRLRLAEGRWREAIATLENARTAGQSSRS